MRFTSPMIFRPVAYLFAPPHTARLSFGPHLPRQLPSFTVTSFLVSGLLALLQRPISTALSPTTRYWSALVSQSSQPSRASRL